MWRGGGWGCEETPLVNWGERWMGFITVTEFGRESEGEPPSGEAVCVCEGERDTSLV